MMKSPKIQIGVMGGAFIYDNKSLESAFQIGKKIADENCTLITGATTGIPYAAALGAQESGGYTIGISPARNIKEHIERFQKPIDGLDAIIYTGMGYNGREPINISSCDGVIYVGGEIGTMIEFGQGYAEGKVLGVLTEVRGISNRIKKILSWINSDYGSEVAYDPDPNKLVEKTLKLIKVRSNNQEYYKRKSNNIERKLRKILENE